MLESEHALVMHPWINRVLRVATVLPGYLLEAFVVCKFNVNVYIYIINIYIIY